MTETEGGSAAGALSERPDPAWIGRLDRVLDTIVWLCMLIAGVLLVVLVAIFGWLVFGRYVLNNTPTWVEQASLLIVVYITFLGAPVGIRQKTHLSIDFLREAMPARVRVPTYYLSDILLIAFGAFMTWQGWGLVLSTLRRAIPMIHIAESWRAVPLMICGVLVMLFSGADILTRLARRATAGD